MRDDEALRRVILGYSRMNITQNFTISELTKTEVRKFDNTPPEAIMPNIKRMAEKLEEIRTLLGYPVIINSCYRSQKVNKAIGSKPTSSHVEGLAADIICPSFGDPLAVAEKIKSSGIRFDQLILEFFDPTSHRGWVHIGIGKKMRQQILTINQHGVFSGLHT